VRSHQRRARGRGCTRPAPVASSRSARAGRGPQPKPSSLPVSFLGHAPPAHSTPLRVPESRVRTRSRKESGLPRPPAWETILCRNAVAKGAAQPAVADGRTPRSLRSLVRPPLNGSIVGQRRMIPSKMSGVAAVAFMSTLACAHQAATSPAAPACSEQKFALRVARDDARETARVEGTPVTIDESRTIYDDARAAWRFWLLVPEATARGRAFIYVRKSDCSAQWEPFLYEM